MTFWLKKTRPQNTMTWPQNVGNRISEDLNFRGCPRIPLQGTTFRGPTIKPPSVKSWICPRVSQLALIAPHICDNAALYVP